jgi:hypothetical protein
MQLTVEHPDGTQSNEQRLSIFGVKDYMCKYNTSPQTTVFWPSNSAFSGYETTLHGRVVNGSETTTLDAQTVYDMLADTSFNKFKTVVLGTDTYILEDHVKHIQQETTLDNTIVVTDTMNLEPKDVLPTTREWWEHRGNHETNK